MDSKQNKRDGQPASYTYAEAGVSIETGNALVRAIAPLARATRRPGADADLGGFGGFFDLKAAGFNDPLLVAAAIVLLPVGGGLNAGSVPLLAVHRARSLLRSTGVGMGDNGSTAGVGDGSARGSSDGDGSSGAPAASSRCRT